MRFCWIRKKKRDVPSWRRNDLWNKLSIRPQTQLRFACICSAHEIQFLSHSARTEKDLRQKYRYERCYLSISIPFYTKSWAVIGGERKCNKSCRDEKSVRVLETKCSLYQSFLFRLDTATHYRSRQATDQLLYAPAVLQQYIWKAMFLNEVKSICFAKRMYHSKSREDSVGEDMWGRQQYCVTFPVLFKALIFHWFDSIFDIAFIRFLDADDGCVNFAQQ